MDFLNRHIQSILSLLRSMTPAAQVSSVIMLVAIIASMVYLFQYQLSGGTTYIFGGQEFSQQEIGQMETALSKAGLNQYEVVGNRIRIPLSSRDKYLKAIADGDAVPPTILRKDDTSLTSTIFLGSTAQNQLLKAQKTKKLEEMLRASPKIANATVEYDSRYEGGPFRKLLMTCSVTINPVGSYQLTRDDVLSIQRTIRGSLAGIQDRDIVIIDSNASQSYTGDMVAMSAAESELIRTKKYFEEDYKRKISAQLVAYQGNMVGVDVELDPTLGTNTYQRSLDTPTTLQQQNERQTSRSQTGGNGGAPGVRSNLPATANASASLSESRQSSNDITKEQTSAIAGGEIKHTQLAGLTVKRVKVSVGIPQKTVEKLFIAANPIPDGTPVTIDRVRLNEFFEQSIRRSIAERVRALIQSNGVVGQDLFEDIVVHMDPSLEMEAIPTTPASETALAWLAANWQHIGLFCFGLVSLVMLRSMVNSAGKNDNASSRADSELDRILPTNEQNDEVEEIIIDKDGTTRIVKKRKSAETEAEREAERQARENQLKKRFNNRQPSIREELAELVEADLDAAASVLRAWVGEPAA